MNGPDDRVSIGRAQLDERLYDRVANVFVFGALIDDPVLLAPADVDHNIAERPVREGAGARPVDRGDLLELERAVAHARGDPLEPLPHGGGQGPLSAKRRADRAAPEIA